VAHRRSLFKYYSDPHWADEFLNGVFRFWSLAYFRHLEDGGVRGDVNEGTATFRPPGGLEITNHTRRKTFTMPGYALKSAANQEEIFVFCVSRSLSARLWDEFRATVCIEITDVSAFCARVEAALPAEASLGGRPGRKRLGQRVEYYRTSDATGTRWALPDRIASSKLTAYEWQGEFRLIFSLTGALAFQNVALTLVPDGLPVAAGFNEHAYCDMDAGNLRDLCRVHGTRPP
jgi:hypothetical protein